MKKIIYLSVIIILLALAGCSSIPPYTPPENGKTAKIEYVVNSLGYGGFGLVYFEGENCTIPKAIIDGKEVPSGSFTLLSGVRISAGKPVRLMPAFIVNKPGVFSTCTAPFEFVPTEGTVYTIEFTTNYNSCGVTLSYLTKDNSLPETSFRALKYNSPFSTNGPYCKK